MTQDISGASNIRALMLPKQGWFYITVSHSEETILWLTQIGHLGQWVECFTDKIIRFHEIKDAQRIAGIYVEDSDLKKRIRDMGYTGCDININVIYRPNYEKMFSSTIFIQD